MRLTHARIQHFRSVEDSEEFEVNDTTCLVGKNESGKTAILEALESINPADKNKITFDKVRDYPRRYLTQYDSRHPEKDATFVITKWRMDDSDKETISNEFGPDSLDDDVIEIRKAYDGKKAWRVPINEPQALKYIKDQYNLSASEQSVVSSHPTSKELLNHLESLNQKSDKLNKLQQELSRFSNGNLISHAIDLLNKRLPMFLYSSHYDRMSGRIAVHKLQEDDENKTLAPGDKIFLEFLQYSGTTLNELKDIRRYEELKAKVEAASTTVTDQIFEYWSQNDSLSIVFDPHEGKPDDQPPFNVGTVMDARVYNSLHRVTVPFSERSAGFVWFFSFLVHFSQVRERHDNLVILLDEPGLSLHGKAQGDLLRYIEEKLKPYHHVIYSTHSPFMVPPANLASVRTVEDVVEVKPPRTLVPRGTKIRNDLQTTEKETIFPLQGALGYEITQTLFVGENNLLVEGPSDVLYILAMSNELRRRDRMSLDSRWTLCPTGGIDNVWAFLSLFTGAQMNVAVLADLAVGGKKKVERLRQSELLHQSQIYTVADFTGREESDIEDLLGEQLFIDLVNRAYNLGAENQVTREGLQRHAESSQRLVVQIESYFCTLPEPIPIFNHYVPAYWITRHPEILESDNEHILEALCRFESLAQTYDKLLD